MTHATLHDEIFEDAVKCRAGVPTGFVELEEGADVVGSPVGFESDFDDSKGCVEFDRAAELVDGGVEKGLDFPGFDGDFLDTNGGGGEAVFASWDLGDFFDDVHAFVDAAEGGEVAVKGRLGGDADEELGAVGVGFGGNADGGDDAAFVFHVREVAGEEIEAAGAPKRFRSFGIFEERVTALDDAVGNGAVEGGTIVEAFTGAGDECVDVLWRLTGSKFEAEYAEAGGDDGFEFGGRLGEGGE